MNSTPAAGSSAGLELGELRPIVREELSSPCGVPGEVWQLIFKWLELPEVCKFGATCRSAATLSFSCEAAWSLVRLPQKCRKAASDILKLGASLGNPLCTHLDATSSPFLEDTALAAAVPWMPRLERINLSGCRRVQGAVIAVVRTCTALTALQCAGCPRLSDCEIVGICQQAGTRLIALDLSGCSSRISDDSARALGKLCTALKELRLAGYKKLSDVGVSAMLAGDDAGEQSAPGLGGGRLASLELSSCEGLTDCTLRSLSNRCSNLQHLDLSISDTFSSAMLSKVLAASSGLKTLDLVGVRGVTDDVLYFLPTTLESIALAACRVSDPGVRAIAERCARAHSVDVAANDRITDDGFCALADLASLRSLNLNYTCISDEALQGFAAAKACQLRAKGPEGSRGNLLVLNLRGCKNVTERGIACLSEIGQSLVHLDVRETRVIRLAAPRILFPQLAAYNNRKNVKAERFSPLNCASACTLLTSGATFVEQHTFRCNTCGIVGKNGICSACAKRCHSGHDVCYNGRQFLYCDCKMFCGPSCCF